MDFVHDKLTNGRPYKMLTVLDEYTREALWVAVKPRMGNAEVLEALYPLFLKRGRPEFIRSDNGPEFIAENFPAQGAVEALNQNSASLPSKYLHIFVEFRELRGTVIRKQDNHNGPTSR